jgi:hypothetical protein
MGDVHNKLKGAHDRRERQLNAIQHHATNTQKFEREQKEGEKTFKEKTFAQKQLGKELAGQQRQTQAEQQALEMAQAVSTPEMLGFMCRTRRLQQWLAAHGVGIAGQCI